MSYNNDAEMTSYVLKMPHLWVNRLFTINMIISLRYFFTTLIP